LAESVNYSVWRPCRRYFWGHPSPPSAERPEFQAGHLPPQLGRGPSLLPRQQRCPTLDPSVLDDSVAWGSIRDIGRRAVSVSLWGFGETGWPGGEGPM